MATESRLVRCKDPDCGHEWESKADDPRCSDPDGICDRARAEVVEDGSSSDDQTQDVDETGTSDEDTDSAWSPLFEVTETDSDTSTDAPPSPSVDTDDDADDDADEDGEDLDTTEVPDLDPEDVRPFLVTAFGGPPTEGDEAIPGLISQRRGDHWELRDHELDQLSRAYARVGNKYLPYLLAEYTVEGLALVTTAMIMAPRIQEDRRRRRIEEEAKIDTGSPNRDDADEEAVVEEELGVEVEETEDEPEIDLSEGAWVAGAEV